MKRKAKGFTVIEVLITLAITTVVLGVVCTFFFTSNKTLTTTEIRSDLQTEAQLIESEILEIGTQSNGISEIQSEDMKLSVEGEKINLDQKYSEIRDVFKDGLAIKSIKFKDNNLIQCTEKQLIINRKVISSNVDKLLIKPLDLYMTDKGSILSTNGLEVTITLKMKKGYSEVEYPLSVIVKFRNQ